MKGRRKENKRCDEGEKERLKREGRKMTDMEKKMERREDEEGKNKSWKKKK